MLYFLEHDTQKKFRYAYKDISLIGYSRLICPQCSRQIAIPQYNNEAPHLVIEGGNVYPDYLQFCGAGNRLCVVSEKTLNLFEQNKITGYTEYHLVTTESDRKSKDFVQCPNYYCLNITGRIDLDIVAMHIKKKRLCPSCGQFEWSRMRLEPIVLNQTIWDGSDLCLVGSIPGFKVCSEKLKEFIQNYNLTGFSFKVAR